VDFSSALSPGTLASRAGVNRDAIVRDRLARSQFPVADLRGAGHRGPPLIDK